jgi:hypothetical protein
MGGMEKPLPANVLFSEVRAIEHFEKVKPNSGFLMVYFLLKSLILIYNFIGDVTKVAYKFRNFCFL